MFGYLIVISIAIGIQYVFFRSAVAVAALTVVVGLGTYFLTRASLARFESRIWFHLNPGASKSRFHSLLRRSTVPSTLL
jgi:hypothetical protein